jgi:murein DD-endopeptidase MepM/ murein hydrolase activator NlpD
MKIKTYLMLICVFFLSIFFTYTYIANLSKENTHPNSSEEYLEPVLRNDDIKINESSLTLPKPESQNIVEIPVSQPALQKPLSFIMPVSGKIEVKFSNDTLAYSKTLQEWNIHKGIDISADAGTPVVASEAGIVKEINNTIDHGIEIIIEHADGYKTIYSNLSSDKIVKVGQKVEKAQTISGIGRTSAFECNDPDHLHFEMYKDNMLVDPENIID